MATKRRATTRRSRYIEPRNFPTRVEKMKGFDILRKKEELYNGDIIENVSIQFKAEKLIASMREITEDSIFYEPAPIKNVNEVFCFVNSIRLRPEKECAELLKFLDKHFVDTRKTIENMTREKTISFDLLWWLFKRGDEVVFIDNGGLKSGGSIQGGKVESCEYQRTFFGREFVLNVKQISSDGRKYRLVQSRFEINQFDGVKKTDLLPVMPMTPEIKKQLVERGEFYRKIANKVSYLDYNGHLVWKEWFGAQLYQAFGRCMIDQVSFFRQNARYEYKSNEDQELELIPDDMLFACKPRVCGFSFATKRWGELSLDNLRPVKFNDDAFDTLVLAKETKHMVRSLVEHAGKSFQDIIYGKGGGCIFLLHGRPGTGKTLTAESIAEVLHRPLYSVSVGELGTDPKSLEASLRSILEMATIWNAVVLIDEADIFLESRHDDSDIDRNAMVGIFLRLLEYHQGILFLTTNRVQTFDRAFHSRISVAIKYPDLTEDDRRHVWENLIRASKLELKRPANVPPIDVDRLAAHEVNGRQIKTAIRLAQALARAEDKYVTTELLERPIIHAENFLAEVENGPVPRLVGKIDTRKRIRARKNRKRRVKNLIDVN